MALFSEKYGYTDSRSVLQFESTDDALRMSIYNALYECIGEYERHSTFESVCRAIWTDYWHYSVDEFPSHYWGFYPFLRNSILLGEWYEGYNLIDFILEQIEIYDAELKLWGAYDPSDWVQHPAKARADYINHVLEREGSAYRIIGGSLAPVTNELELNAFDQSTNGENSFEGAGAHFKRALALFSKKPDPDYLGSCRESILAAESAAMSVAPEKCDTLPKAVGALQKTKGLHKALADAWKKMFGYTSDADGIRHAGTGEPVDVDFAFAKYMLVTCSAFVNYLAEEFGQDE